MLETVDLSAHITREEYESQKEAARNALRQAQLKAWQHRLGVLIVLEGWSFSGRASCARLLAESTDPRGLKVHVVYPPTKEELRYPFARRYWSLLPSHGNLALFVRSWYWHLLDDQVRRRRPPLRQAEVIEEVRD